MLRVIRWVLLALIVGNWLSIVVVTGVMGALLFVGAPMTAEMTRQALPGHEVALRHILAALCAVGIGIAAAADIFLRRLLAITGTVAENRPFAPINAARLLHMAWALLAIQLSGIAVAVLAAIAQQHKTPPTPLDPDLGPQGAWLFGLSGWLAVLLLFALARVFAHGAAMQEEIEGTV
jgi:hypothetical protein